MDEADDALRSELLGARAARQNDVARPADATTASGGVSSATGAAGGGGGGGGGGEEDEDAAHAELLSGGGLRGAAAGGGSVSDALSLGLEDLNFDHLDMTGGVGSGAGGEDDEVDAFLAGLEASHASGKSGLEQLAADPELLRVMEEVKDLRAYAAEQEAELETSEHAAVDAYLEQEDTIAALAEDMASCDATLGELEEVLHRFQAAVGGMGAEIRDLQNECLSHQVKLENRKRLEADLGAFIDGVNVSKSLSHAILHDKVDDVYLEYLIRFNQQISFIENHRLLDDGKTEAAAYKEVAPQVQELQKVAQRKVREFVSAQVQSARHALSRRVPGEPLLGKNGAVRKLHKQLVDYAYFFQFMFKHSPDAADEIRSWYETTMTQLYTQHFRDLVAAASRRQYVLASKNDLIGVEESKLRGFFSGRKTIKNKASVFSLGLRQDIVDVLGEAPSRTGEELLLLHEGGAGSGVVAGVVGTAAADAVGGAASRFTSLLGGGGTGGAPPSPSGGGGGGGSGGSDGAGDAGASAAAAAAADPNARHAFELLFRSIVWDLMEALTDEVMFARDFFLGLLDDEAVAAMFERSLAAVQDEWLARYVVGSYDAIGVLLCLVHVQRYRGVMRDRMVPGMESFFAEAHDVLARRVFQLFSLNAESITQATANAASLSTGDIHVHYMTRRFAEFVGSVSHLCSRCAAFGEKKFADKVMQNLVTVREALQRLLTALAVAKLRDKRAQTVFLINNLDLIVSVIRKREPSPSAAPAARDGAAAAAAGGTGGGDGGGGASASAAAAAGAGSKEGAVEAGVDEELAMSAELLHFELLLKGKIQALARVELDQRFGDLIDFARRHEGIVGAAATSAGGEAALASMSISATERDVEALLRHFHDTWRKALQEMQATVLADFSNFQCGQQLLSLILTELVSAYTVVATVVRTHFKALRTSKFFVPEATVEAEMQKSQVSF